MCAVSVSVFFILKFFIILVCWLWVANETKKRSTHVYTHARTIKRKSFTMIWCGLLSMQQIRTSNKQIEKIRGFIFREKKPKKYEEIRKKNRSNKNLIVYYARRRHEVFSSIEKKFVRLNLGLKCIRYVRLCVCANCSSMFLMCVFLSLIHPL